MIQKGDLYYSAYSPMVSQTFLASQPQTVRNSGIRSYTTTPPLQTSASAEPSLRTCAVVATWALTGECWESMASPRQPWWELHSWIHIFSWKIPARSGWFDYCLLIIAYDYWWQLYKWMASDNCSINSNSDDWWPRENFTVRDDKYLPHSPHAHLILTAIARL